MHRFSDVCSTTATTRFTILKHRLRHVLQMSSHRIPYRVLFSDAGTNWKKRRDGQRKRLCLGMKESSTELASVGPSRPLGWCFRDDATVARNVNRHGSE
ncbi:unnamed protein product [Schistosoma curassoni]|uniref:Uncharacterized protein n=1 Tax=Schistosoma curassoni TaxID=6186 RepID=A0A183KF57_9TREM|nr:unnamed protein product [Schistosoma curassoni]